jgi:hypothetical protein
LTQPTPLLLPPPQLLLLLLPPPLLIQPHLLNPKMTTPLSGRKLGTRVSLSLTTGVTTAPAHLQMQTQRSRHCSSRSRISNHLRACLGRLLSMHSPLLQQLQEQAEQQQTQLRRHRLRSFVHVR